MSPAPPISTRPTRASAAMLADMEDAVSPGAQNPREDHGPAGSRTSLLNASHLAPQQNPRGAPGLAFETSSGAPRLSQDETADRPPRSCEATLCSLTQTESSEPVLPDAQRRWAARSIPERLQPIRKARHWIAAHPEAFAKAISADLARSEADTLTTELLPLLEAMRFLERRAHRILAPRKLGIKDRPLWLAGVQAELHHDPLGHILVIGPSNFPLFLPGVQTLQALVAGNAVTWKPGEGGAEVAQLLTHALREAGLPRGILHVTDESVEAAEHALAGPPDKVIFTGSFETGRKILSTLAPSATPAVMELSGADAVVVLPSANLQLTAKAVAFGLRLNGGEVCMSPRRLIATRETLNALRPLLIAELAKVPPVPLKPRTAEILSTLLQQAIHGGAELINLDPPSPFDPSPLVPQRHTGPATHTGPILLDRANAGMAITRSDLFAPVLSLIEARSTLELPDLVNDNPYALTVAVFGNAREARALAAQLRVGSVIINDLIAPTADPRIPFGGRAHSGFGVTRGAEGLLEMTATRTALIRRKGITQHYDPLSDRDAPLFAALIGVLHGGSLSDRWRSLKALISHGRAKVR